jgi:hypothetical protein
MISYKEYQRCIQEIQNPFTPNELRRRMENVIREFEYESNRGRVTGYDMMNGGSMYPNFPTINSFRADAPLPHFRNAESKSQINTSNKLLLLL